ncbi:hypothetical protein B566_EDAN014766, partial [Ephemera danica]
IFCTVFTFDQTQCKLSITDENKSGLLVSVWHLRVFSTMKSILACLLLVAVAQATIIPMRRTLPPIVRRPVVNNPHIIGGTLATDGQFPYQAAVLMDNSYFCGGSVVAADQILTAGHCVSGFASFDITVGTENRNNNEPGRQDVTSRSSTLHADYGPILIVWRLLIFHAEAWLEKLHVCPAGEKSVTEGDSGGPLVLYEGSEPYEVGIVSFGSSAGCESGAPAAFTRTTEYLDWIAANAPGVTIRP